MSALNRTPENTNLLQPTKFLLTLDRTPSVTYFCQEANIPGISVAEIEVPTPLHDYPVHGNKMMYSHFNVKFILGEDLSSWINIHEWMRSFADPHGFQQRNYLSEVQNQYKKQKQKSYSDGTLTLLSNLNNPILRVQFHNLFPVSLSDINFDTTLSAETTMTADASFAFEYFDFLDA